MHAKAAVADMWLVLFVTLAHWAGYELIRESRMQEIRESDDKLVAVGSFTFALAFGFLARGAHRLYSAPDGGGRDDLLA